MMVQYKMTGSRRHKHNQAVPISGSHTPVLKPMLHFHLATMEDTTPDYFLLCSNSNKVLHFVFSNGSPVAWPLLYPNA